MAHRDPVGIRLITRRGNDWSDRFPLVVEAVNHLKVRSCLIDGEVVCCDERGLARFDVLRRRHNEADAFLYAFDLLELDGTDRSSSVSASRCYRPEPVSISQSLLRYSVDGLMTHFSWIGFLGRLDFCLGREIDVDVDDNRLGNGLGHTCGTQTGFPFDVKIAIRKNDVEAFPIESVGPVARRFGRKSLVAFTAENLDNLRIAHANFQFVVLVQVDLAFFVGGEGRGGQRQ
jgi:hypothetical protein